VPCHRGAGGSRPVQPCPSLMGRGGRNTAMHNPKALRLKFVRIMILFLFSFSTYNPSIRCHYFL
jgi:hypothetical protein